MNKKVYLIGIGGIGVSAIARYYLSQGWDVYGSDKTNSQLIENLISEGCNIIIGEDAARITRIFSPSPAGEGAGGGGLVVHTEAIPETQSELMKARELGLDIFPYNKALGHIANKHKLVAVAGTHGKSTTTSLTSIMLKNSDLAFGAVVGTILKEFDKKNFYSSIPPLGSREGARGGVEESYFAIEACEYKRHFLEYKPYIGIITNIELDHLDYYSGEDDYIDAFEKFIENIIPGGYAILNGDDKNCKKLVGLRNDITYIEVNQQGYIKNPSQSPLIRGEEAIFSSPDKEGLGEVGKFPDISMRIPGDHILFDAKLVYVAGKILGIPEATIISSLESYTGVWRRMEIIGETENDNMIMSDYGHHPTEIEVTTKALREGYPDKKLFVVFQPHQYSRTIELLDGFKKCFSHCDTVIIPNIYESRDSEEDKARMNTEKLISEINHENIQNGNGMENTLKLIKEYDKKNPASSIILLLGAGNVDDLRFELI